MGGKRPNEYEGGGRIERSRKRVTDEITVTIIPYNRIVSYLHLTRTHILNNVVALYNSEIRLQIGLAVIVEV